MIYRRPSCSWRVWVFECVRVSVCVSLCVSVFEGLCVWMYVNVSTWTSRPPWGSGRGEDHRRPSCSWRRTSAGSAQELTRPCKNNTTIFTRSVFCHIFFFQKVSWKKMHLQNRRISSNIIINCQWIHKDCLFQSIPVLIFHLLFVSILKQCSRLTSFQLGWFGW